MAAAASINSSSQPTSGKEAAGCVGPSSGFTKYCGKNAAMFTHWNVTRIQGVHVIVMSRSDRCESKSSTKRRAYHSAELLSPFLRPRRQPVFRIRMKRSVSKWRKVWSSNRIHILIAADPKHWCQVSQFSRPCGASERLQLMLQI